MHFPITVLLTVSPKRKAISSPPSETCFYFRGRKTNQHSRQLHTAPSTVCKSKVKGGSCCLQGRECFEAAPARGQSLSLSRGCELQHQPEPHHSCAGEEASQIHGMHSCRMSPSQNQAAELRRDLRVCLVQALLQQGRPEQGAQDHIHAALEISKGELHTSLFC